MINKYLDVATSNLKQIIELTKNDLEDIKTAKHDKVMYSSEQKNKFLLAFEKNKKSLDNELLKLANANPNINLADLLGDETKTRLAILRNTLLELKELNRNYAKNVVIVKEFFDSLVGSMLGKTTQNNYTSKAITANDDDIFKARV